MNKFFKSILMAATITVCSIAPQVSFAQDPNQPDQAPDQQAVTLQDFYDQLAPYGQWINYPNYGYVFVPNAGPGFIPYSTSGHWAYTNDYGWTWASDYPWGWACFHYGRWNYDPSYGWFWVPDTQWGPAWVVWRNSDQYYGWAPLPSGVDINMGINNGYGIPPDHWCFVPTQYMGDPYIYNYYMPRSNNDIFIAHSAFIIRMNFDHGHRYNFFTGPDRFEVERFRHNPIQPVVIRYNSDPHHAWGANEVGFYRPAVVARHDQGGRPDNNYAPVRSVRVEDVPRRDFDRQPHNVNLGAGGDHRGDDHRDHH